LSPKKTFTFAISDEMKAALTHLRERDGISEAEQIRRGIQMWLDSKGVKAERKRAVTRKRP
jgi:Arc/MetJ-type ribon-helix-helix transcriptional regulator